MYRSILLSCVLLVLSIMLYGYGRPLYDNFSYASLPALQHLYPENFKNDPLFDENADRYPVYTFILEQIYRTYHEEIFFFVIFLLAKFFLFLGMLRMASLVLPENILIPMSGILLFPGFEMNLQFSGPVLAATMIEPRTVSAGFFYLGFVFLLESKRTWGAVFLGLASMIHPHFAFLALPMLILSEIIFAYKNKKLSGKNFISPVIFLVLASPNIINSLAISPVLFSNTSLIKEIYVDTIAPYHFDPKYFLPLRGPIFLIALIPLFFYKKIEMEKYQKILWYSVLCFITFGTIVTIVFTSVYFRPWSIFVWYGGHSQIIWMTSFLFTISLITKNWKTFGIVKKIIIVAVIYASSLIPFLGIFLGLLAHLMEIIIKNYSYRKLAPQFFSLITLITLSPFLTDGYSQFNVLRRFDKRNLNIPRDLYTYIKNSTSIDSNFLAPPVGFDALRSVAMRSVVVDAKIHHSGKYLETWKERLIDVAGDGTAKLLTPLMVSTNEFYLKKPPNKILELAAKYNADHFITGSSYKNIFSNDKHFNLIYSDNDYALYAIKP